MKAFNPQKRYLGPEGHWLTPIIPPNPPSVPQLYLYWNRAAYNHDVGYAGKRKTGLFGWISNMISRKKIDDKFHDQLYAGIRDIEKSLSDQELQEAMIYADIVYKAVRVGGWSFYRNRV